MMLSQAELADLEAELTREIQSDFLHGNSNSLVDEGYYGDVDDLQSFFNAKDTSTNLTQFPGVELLFRSKRYLESLRIDTSAIINELQDVVMTSDEPVSLVNNQTTAATIGEQLIGESPFSEPSSRETSEFIGDIYVDGESLSSPDECTSTNDIFNTLLEKATKQANEDDRIVDKRRREREQAIIDRRKVIAMNRNARVVYDAVNRMYRISTLLHLEYSLQRWITFLKTRRKAAEIIRRFFIRYLTSKPLAICQRDQSNQLDVVTDRAENAAVIRLDGRNIIQTSNSEAHDTFPYSNALSSPVVVFVQSVVGGCSCGFGKLAAAAFDQIQLYVVDIAKHSTVVEQTLVPVSSQQHFSIQRGIDRLNTAIEHVSIGRAFNVMYNQGVQLKATMGRKRIRTMRAISGFDIVLKAGLIRRGFNKLTCLRHQYISAILIQKTFRGYLVRKRLRLFKSSLFNYTDNDLGSILDTDINDLVDFKCNDDTANETDWIPKKPAIHHDVLINKAIGAGEGDAVVETTTTMLESTSNISTARQYGLTYCTHGISTPLRIYPRPRNTNDSAWKWLLKDEKVALVRQVTLCRLRPILNHHLISRVISTGNPFKKEVHEANGVKR